MISAEQRQKHTQRFDGSVVKGEVIRDLCPLCIKKYVPEGMDLKPLRRRKKKASTPS